MKTKLKHEQFVKKGQILLKESPFIYGLKSTLRYERCDYCFLSTKVLKCSSCKYISYCDKSCQKMGWEIHKSECVNLRKITPRIVPDAARILARLIVKLKKGGGTERSFYTKNNSRVFKDLMSHYSDIKEDSKRMEHFTSLSNVLKDFIGEENMPNTAELLGMYGRLVVNGFNILDPEMISIGTGIYLGVSVIDHSCNPNAVAVFEGNTIYIRSLVDMSEFDWSKVFISYIELLNNVEERQKDLLENYYFLCDCSRCKDLDETNLHSSILCPNDNCASPIPVKLMGCTDNGIFINCPSCRTNIKPGLVNQYQEAYEFVDRQLQDMKSVAYLDICKKCLEKQGELFHPLNLQRVKVLDSIFESCVSLNQWFEALNFGKQLLPGYKRYYGELHPLTGILQLKLAKICIHLGCESEARPLLSAADQVLQVTHGREHSLYRQHLIPLLAQLQ